MDHDPLIKELLKVFFVEFLRLFLPEMAAYLESNSIEFLDKEFFTDLGSGDRHTLDLLVKVRFKNQDAYFLVHVESQATAQSEFSFRMFRYSMLVHVKTRLPVYPIGIFTYDKPHRPESNEYNVRFPDLWPIRYRYRVIQLNRMDWRKFVKRPNPVAAALMTKMKIATRDRPRVKLECLRMIATLRLDKARATLIGMFMESYLKLTARENAVYNRHVEALSLREKEAIMKYTTPWIEEGRLIGRQQGLEEGRQEGRAEGRLALIHRQLRRRIGDISVRHARALASLSESQLDDLAEALLDFQSPSDLTTWLARHKKR